MKIRKPISQIASTLQNSMQAIASRAEDLDSDKDGLKDWEEVLWKTDINKADTDADGYSDKQEVDEGYDPTDSSSNPSTGKKMENQEQFASLATSSAINLTQGLTKTIGFQIYKSGGKEMPDLSDPLKLMDSDTTQGLAEFVAGFNIRISEKELKVSSDNSKTAIQIYYNDINKILTVDVLTAQSRTDPDNIAVYIQNKDYTFVDKNIQALKEVISRMKSITIPSEFFTFHKRFIELLMAQERVFESIKEIERDPLKTILGMQEGEKINKEMDDLIAQFMNLYAKSNQ